MHAVNPSSQFVPHRQYDQISAIKLDAEMQFFLYFLEKRSRNEGVHFLLWKMLDGLSIEDFSRIGMTLRLTNAYILTLFDDMDRESAESLGAHGIAHMEWLESALCESEIGVRLFLFRYLSGRILESPFSNESQDDRCEDGKLIH